MAVYWHLELPHHDLILAEGLSAESYLDTGNRGAFTTIHNPRQIIAIKPDEAPAPSCFPPFMNAARFPVSR